MTKAELADLEVAIGLINNLRAEMQNGFTSVNSNIATLSASQAAHLAVHAEREKVTDSRGVTKRWVIGVVTTATLTIIGIILSGVYKILGI